MRGSAVSLFECQGFTVTFGQRALALDVSPTSFTSDLKLELRRKVRVA